MKIGDADKYSLEQIASWKRDIIPDLQRDLVWKPKQMELLWDSIMRGFPIGSFIFAESSDGNAYLIDGQQRYNTISLGYNIGEKPTSILWLDISPKAQTTRKYWIKATTISHPWGYANNDDCGFLSAGQRRDALEEYELDSNIYREPISLYDTWPYEAGLPIPLSCILNTDITDKESFKKSVAKNLLNAKRFKIFNKHKTLKTMYIEDVAEEIAARFYHVVKNISTYRIGFSKLSKDAFQETSEDICENDSTALEVLFNRLNTGGTRISPDELFYSAIKSYWGEIKNNNDTIAANYHIPAVKLAILSFRLYKTLRSGVFEKDLSIFKIRELATNNTDDKSNIVDFYSYELEDLISGITSWFDDEGIPKIIKTSIVRNSTDVFLLMMYLKKTEESFDPAFARSLMLYLHWFTPDKKKRKAVEAIFNECVKNDDNTDIYIRIKRGISCCLINDWSTFLVSPKILNKEISVLFDPDNKFELPASSLWIDTFNVITNNRTYSSEMLLLAQKEYMNRTFRQYDPGNETMWEEHNRPWDYDHIIPQEWIDGENREGEFQEFCKGWLNNIGNFAAIPFELNRAKQNVNDFSEYISNSKELMFDQEQYCRLDENITYNREQSLLFASVTGKRMCEIYSRTFSIVEHLLEYESISVCECAFARMELFQKIKQHIPDVVVSYVVNQKEYLIGNDEIINWNRDWMSIGIIHGPYYLCITTSPHYTRKEIGIRRAPLQEKVATTLPLDIQGYKSDQDNPWWYCYKLIRTYDADYLISELNNLISAFDLK